MQGVDVDSNTIGKIATGSSSSWPISPDREEALHGVFSRFAQNYEKREK